MSHISERNTSHALPPQRYHHRIYMIGRQAGGRAGGAARRARPFLIAACQSILIMSPRAVIIKKEGRKEDATRNRKVGERERERERETVGGRYQAVARPFLYQSRRRRRRKARKQSRVGKIGGSERAALNRQRRRERRGE